MSFFVDPCTPTSRTNGKDYGTPEGRGSILIASDGDTKNAWAATPSNTYI